jgi:uncharacterized protein with HEPN domain
VSPRIWQERVQDILDAVTEIGAFLTGLSFDQLSADARTLEAVTADLAIIGEAARRVPDVIVTAHPEVPWALMRGMRNRIMHEYFRVDPKIVWDTCQHGLPLLVEPRRKILTAYPSP